MVYKDSPSTNTLKITAREAAFFALSKESYASDTINSYKKFLTKDDFTLAREIALGSIRRKLSLDYFAKIISGKDQKKLKKKEKALLHLSLYQHYFMDKIPLYAIVNESVSLAKKHLSKRFASFLNAVLRKMDKKRQKLPKDLSIYYSFPTFFINILQKDYGSDLSKEILEALNTPPQLIARARKQVNSFEKLMDKPFLVVKLPHIIDTPNFYIQNITPIALIGDMCQLTKKPKSILDLCASPGGKAIAAHDFFPESQLFLNDLSKTRIQTLKRNLDKYLIQAKQISCYPAEKYPIDQTFDIIILDVPCSNSGVLNKRVEARWRLCKQTLKELSTLQYQILKRACSLLSSNGAIWYLTCSILKQENEEITTKACKEFNLVKAYEKTILPNTLGWDGGYGCLLKQNRLQGT